MANVLHRHVTGQLALQVMHHFDSTSSGCTHQYSKLMLIVNVKSYATFKHITVFSSITESSLHIIQMAFQSSINNFITHQLL